MSNSSSEKKRISSEVSENFTNMAWNLIDKYFNMRLLEFNLGVNENPDLNPKLWKNNELMLDVK